VETRKSQNLQDSAQSRQQNGDPGASLWTNGHVVFDASVSAPPERECLDVWVLGW